MKLGYWELLPLTLIVSLGFAGCTAANPPSTTVAAVTVMVTGPSTVNVGSSSQFTAVASSNTPQTFTWQVNGVTGGNATSGTISATGVYTPPVNVPAVNTLTITAVNTYATTASGSESVTLLAIVPVITAAVASTTTFGQSYLLDVQGSDFLLGASLVAGGVALPTTAISANHLQATVTPAIVGIQQISVAVQNPAPGPSQSNTASVTLNPLPPPTTQEEWITDVALANTSPATAATGDSQISWIAPDTRTVSIVVNAPHPSAAAPTVSLGTYTAGADATPVFNTAINSARTLGAAKITVPNGVYIFKTLGPGSGGHLVISGLTDVTIDGGGSTFIFTQPFYNGIFMFTSQRVKLTNFTIQWQPPTLLTYTATMSTDGSGVNTLVVDPAYQGTVTSADTIGHITEFNKTTSAFIANGARVYQPTYTYNSATHSYSSTSWQGSSYAGRSYIVFEHYYNGAGIEIEDTAGPAQSHDIILDNITINNGPGMGIIAYGLQRGLVISNSHIIPMAGSLISTEYDGMHMLLAAGDVYVHDNVISQQGDDGINFNNPVTPVISVDATGLNPTLGVYSRFIQTHDLLSFFDATNNFVGTAYAYTAPIAQGGLNYTVQLSNSIPGLNTSMIIRDMDLVNSRTAFVNNTVENCACHGILMQTPNALVQGNTFLNTSGNGIRLLSNIGTFQEGVGAINVLVQNNTLTGMGTDVGIHAMPWAALSLYAANDSGINTVVSNKWVNILNNTVNNANQVCITVVASELVNVTGNSCNNTGLSPHGVPSMEVVSSDMVSISGNVRTGTTTGTIYVDPTTTSGVVYQSTY